MKSNWSIFYVSIVKLVFYYYLIKPRWTIKSSKQHKRINHTNSWKKSCKNKEKTLYNFPNMIQLSVWVSALWHLCERRGTQTAIRDVWPLSIFVFISVDLSSSVLPPWLLHRGCQDRMIPPGLMCAPAQTAGCALSKHAAELRPSLPAERN